MTILSLTLTAVLSGLVLSVALDLRRLSRRARQRDHELETLQARLQSAVILPDREGQFRLMAKVNLSGGFGDGETRFVPLSHNEDTLHLHWVKEDGVEEQTYSLTTHPDGSILGKVLSA